MRRFLTLLFLVSGIFSIQQSFSQGLIDYRRLADRAFKDGDYYVASEYYQKIFTDIADSNYIVRPYRPNRDNNPPRYYDDFAYVTYQLGESYRNFQDWTHAEEWYAKAVALNSPDYPVARYWYAVSLRANQKYERALEEFERFKKEYKPAKKEEQDYAFKTDFEIECCLFAIDAIKNPRAVTIEMLQEPVNVDTISNFATAWQLSVDSNIMIFTSSRPTEPVDPKKVQKKKVNPYLNNIYYTANSGDSWQSPYLAEIDRSKNQEQGTTTFSSDGRMMYFTRWKHQDKTIESAIYKSKLSDNGKWSEPEELSANVNMKDTRSLQPFLTRDGKMLFFVSNRPGGSGGLDIFYCEMDTAGNPGVAYNIGSEINSEGDEQAPYYDEQRGILYFSTNGRVGLGNLDLHTTKGSIIGGWEEPKNMGYPVNTGKDDNYFSQNGNSKDSLRGFLSSDRTSTCCYQIYSYEKLILGVCGRVVDADQPTMPVEDAKVTLVDSVTGKEEQSLLTPKSGRFCMDLITKKGFKLVVSKEGYFTKEIPFTTRNFTKSDTVDLGDIRLKQFEIGVPYRIENIYYEFAKADLLPQSKVVLDSLAEMLKLNASLLIELSSHCDSVDTEEFNLDLSYRRAKSCVDYLITKGMRKDLLIAKGYGESQPAYPNSFPDGRDNPVGRQLNRRTEFKILEVRPPDSQKAAAGQVVEVK